MSNGKQPVIIKVLLRSFSIGIRTNCAVITAIAPTIKAGPVYFAASAPVTSNLSITAKTKTWVRIPVTRDNVTA